MEKIISLDGPIELPEYFAEKFGAHYKKNSKEKVNVTDDIIHVRRLGSFSKSKIFLGAILILINTFLIYGFLDPTSNLLSRVFILLILITLNFPVVAFYIPEYNQTLINNINRRTKDDYLNIENYDGKKKTVHLTKYDLDWSLDENYPATLSSLSNLIFLSGIGFSYIFGMIVFLFNLYTTGDSIEIGELIMSIVGISTGIFILLLLSSTSDALDVLVNYSKLKKYFIHTLQERILKLDDLLDTSLSIQELNLCLNLTNKFQLSIQNLKSMTIYPGSGWATMKNFVGTAISISSIMVILFQYLSI